MGRQWNTIIESLGPLSGGTMSITANLTDIEALVTTIQADIANGIDVNHLTDGTQKTKIVDANGNNISYITAGTAGTPSSNVLSVQGITGATPIAASISLGTSTIGYVNLQDGSGNAITSSSIAGKQRLDVNLSSAGTIGSSVPTTANLYAGTDGTNLRAISVDTNGRVNVNQVRGATTIGTLTAGTTNGTLFATNSTRNYLLVQCTSGTAYIDTNGTATTGDGVLLTSGQGITFEGSFIPTGAIAAITSTGTARLIGRQG
jgi:hypothetical protein